MPPQYEIFLEKRVIKQLGKLEQKIRFRILKALRVLQKEGFSAKLDVKKLQGYKKHYRLRVGDYRVLFELQPERTVVVYEVLPRKVAY